MVGNATSFTSAGDGFGAGAEEGGGAIGADAALDAMGVGGIVTGFGDVAGGGSQATSRAVTHASGRRLVGSIGERQYLKRSKTDGRPSAVGC